MNIGPENLGGGILPDSNGEDFLNEIEQSLSLDEKSADDFVLMIFDRMGTWDTTVCTPLVREFFDRINAVYEDVAISPSDKFIRLLELRGEYEKRTTEKEG